MFDWMEKQTASSLESIFFLNVWRFPKSMEAGLCLTLLELLFPSLSFEKVEFTIYRGGRLSKGFWRSWSWRTFVCLFTFFKTKLWSGKEESVRRDLRNPWCCLYTKQATCSGWSLSISSSSSSFSCFAIPGLTGSHFALLFGSVSCTIWVADRVHSFLEPFPRLISWLEVPCCWTVVWLLKERERKKREIKDCFTRDTRQS